MSQTSSQLQAKSAHTPSGYPRACEYCASRTEYYDAAELGRHLRVAHSTKEGGSFLCRYGPNGVCPHLPPEGVSDSDYEAHLRRFHTAAEIAMKTSGASMSTGSAHPLGEGSTFTINSTVHNLSSALCDPCRSRSESAVFFTRHWGEAFTPLQPVVPSPTLQAITAPTLLAQVERNLKTYKKFAHTKRTLKKQRAQALEDERADVDDLPTFLVEDSFDLSKASSFDALFTRPRDGQPDPLASVLKAGATRSMNPFDEPDQPRRRTAAGKNPFLDDDKEGQMTSTSRASRNPFDSPEWRDRRELQTRLEAMHDAVDARLASRSNLRVASMSICDRTSRLMRLYERREEKRKLLSKLHDMSCLREAQSTVQALLSQGEYPRVLECIQTSSEVVNTELDGVIAFRHLSQQLTEMRNVIGKMMKEELATLIQREFGARVDDAGHVVHEGELLSVLLGLAQLRSFSFVAMLKNEIGEATKTIVRQVCKAVVVERGDVVLLENMGDAVRALSFADWLELLTAVLEALYLFALRIETLQTLVIELLERVWPEGFPDDDESMRHSPTPVPIEEMEDDDSDLDDGARSLPSSTGQSATATRAAAASTSAVLPVDIRSLAQLRRALGKLVEYAQECAQVRVARLMHARDLGEERARTLPSASQIGDQMRRVRAALAKVEARGWQHSRVLETAAERSTVDHLERFHRRRKEVVCDVLDRELWKPAEVPQAIQELAYRLVRGEVEETSGDETDRLSLPGSTAPSVVGDSTTLCVGDDRYVVVGSALLAVSALHEHVAMATVLPSAASRLLMRTVELLKAFNSRACQLILGAGALQLVGLKTISVKNLALASRSLQLVASFIPAVERSFGGLLAPGDAAQLRYFEKVQRDYADHVSEIVSKLISVIEHHTTNCLNTWTVAGAPPSLAMQTLCKQLGKFHAGLYGIMPDDQIRALFASVHRNFQRLLKARFESLKISPQDVLSYGIVCEDFSFYVRSIKAMPACDNLDLGTMADVLAAI